MCQPAAVAIKVSQHACVALTRVTGPSAALQVLLTSHLGRPKDGPEDKFRLNPVVPRLSELLGKAVQKADDCIGEAVTSKLAEMSNGDVRPSACACLPCGAAASRPVLASCWNSNHPPHPA